MKNLIFEINHDNWDLLYDGCWESTNFKIYDDLSIEIKDNYCGDETIKIPDFIKNLEPEKIDKKDLDSLIKLVDKAKKINVRIDACDGEAWEFIYYNDNKMIWKRELDYIYGIRPLEKMTKILEKYHSVD